MDENKDFTTPENINEEEAAEAVTAAEESAQESVAETTEAVEEAAEETTETVEEAVESGTELPNEFTVVSENEEADALPAPAKKKPILMKTIVISIVIVVLAAITALAIKLFVNNSVSGTWHLVREVQVMDDNATSDEATHPLNVDYYFDFKDDGTVSSTIGTVTGTGTYKESKDENGKTVVTMDIYDTLTQYFLNGNYTAEISGNFFTGKTMKFTSVDNPEKTYDFESAKYTAPEIKREGEFTPNDDIVGKWTYSTGEFTLVYEFDKNGNAKYTEKAMSINPYTYQPMNIDISMSGIYNVSDSTVTITYFFLEQSDRDMQFRLDGDTLYINDYPFTKDGAATKDQAQNAVPAQ